MRVVLVQPPYLRGVGSHNDRAPLELCYLHAWLGRTPGIEPVVFNADWTGANKYISWGTLFENSHMLGALASGDSPLIDETVERVLCLDPQVVVLSAADGVTPWSDLGSAYVAAALSRRLRQFGLFTVGVGPFLSRVPNRFVRHFDAIVTGVAPREITETLQQRLTGIVNGTAIPIDVLPNITCRPGGQAAVVMTAFGCPFSCDFCFANDQPLRQIPIPTVVQDIRSRPLSHLEFGDAILPVHLGRLRELAERCGPLSKTFSCEIKANTCDPERLRLLRAIGVTTVKLGVESGDNAALKLMRKHQDTGSIMAAVENIRKFGFRLVCYVLLGGSYATEESHRATLALCKELAADDYVINVCAFDDLPNRDFALDAHFSMSLVHRWGIGRILDEFLALQSATKIDLGELLFPRADLPH